MERPKLTLTDLLIVKRLEQFLEILGGIPQPVSVLGDTEFSA